MKVGIIGGGATGLTAGYELSKKGHSVTIFEAEDKLGGLVDTLDVGCEKLEKFYHHIFTSDIHIIDLIDELGLQPELMWKSPANGIFINNTMYPFTSPMDLLRFKELSLIDRIRLGLLVYKAKLVKDWRELESMNAREWIVKNAGTNVYEKVWKPLLNSKFDTDADKVSATWIWNKFKLRGSTRSKNISKELLGYMKGSFEVIYRKLADKICEMGGNVLCSHKVTGIASKVDETIDVTVLDKVWNFDRVIVTVAPEVLKEMDLGLPAEYSERLAKIKYKSNICMILELSEQLSPYYWITIAEEGFPFVLLVEHTNLVGVEGYDSHIVYLSRYMDENSEFYRLSDSQLIEQWVEYLKKMFPGWDYSYIKKIHISRARFAQPVVMTGYSKIVPGFRTPVKNLYLACMAQIYPEDRGQNYAVRMGKEVASTVCHKFVPIDWSRFFHDARRRIE